MRLRHASGRDVHLGYCTNVHAAHDVAGVTEQLDRYARPVRERLGVDRVGVGAWFAADVVHTLRRDAIALRRLRDGLRRSGGEVVTVNAFPYGAFQADVVKHAVYHPDWTTLQRLAYTVDAAWVLAELLPDDVEAGSISTLPLAWREPWDDARADAARRHLDLLAEELARVERSTGRTIRVGLEPEPGCVVETVAQAADALAQHDTDRLGVCLDLCHLATGYGEASDAVEVLDAAGVRVVKAQVSAALHVERPHDPGVRSALGAFAEDRFLHQVRRPGGDPHAGWDDLPEALAGAAVVDGGRDDESWRVHFHVPLHQQPAHRTLTSTTGALQDSLRVLVGGEELVVDHLDVESYTWHVLPPDQRPTTDDALVAGIAAELAWAADHLQTLGLEPA